MKLNYMPIYLIIASINLQSLAHDMYFDAYFGSQGNGYTQVVLDDANAVIDFQMNGENQLTSVVQSSKNHYLLSLQENGLLDDSFGKKGAAKIEFQKQFGVTSLAVDSKHRKLLAGCELSDSTNMLLLRTLADGALDQNFGEAGSVSLPIGAGSVAWSVSLQNDEKILLAGSFVEDGFSYGIALRCDENGLLDRSFGSEGKVVYRKGLNSRIGAIVADSRKNILIAGNKFENNQSTVFINRYTSAGELDESFGVKGEVALELPNYVFSKISLIVQENDTILMGTASSDTLFLAKLSSNGQFDKNFGLKGIAAIPTEEELHCNGLLVHEDGMLFMWGKTKSGGFITSLTQHGEVNEKFGTKGTITDSFGKNTQFSAAALKKDGKILVGGCADKKSIFAQYRLSNGPDVSLCRDLEAEETFSKSLWGQATLPTAQVAISINGMPFKTVMTDEQGIWHAGDSLLNEGDNEIELTLIKDGKTIKNTKHFFSIQAQNFIKISQFQNNTISGTSSKAATQVALYVDGAYNQKTVTDKSGNWSAPLEGLVNGKHKILVELIVNEKVVASDTTNIVIDNKDTVTLKQIITISSLTSNLKLSGSSSQANCTVNIVSDGSLLGTLKTDKHGNWCSNNLLKLPLGQHLITVLLVSDNYNILASACSVVNIQKTPLS